MGQACLFPTIYISSYFKIFDPVSCLYGSCHTARRGGEICVPIFNMKIGYQALFEERNIIEVIDFAKSNNFSLVEINLNSPYFFPENYGKEKRNLFKERSKDLRIILHAPEGLGIVNLQKSVREACVKRLAEIIDFGYDIGAKSLTFHIGMSVPIAVSGKKVRFIEIYEEIHRELIDETLRWLTNYADSKIALCVENTGDFKQNLAKQILTKFLANNSLYLTWDIGHTNILNREDKRVEEDFFTKYVDKIRVCHMHDNHGKTDEHNIIGDGNVDFIHYVNLLKDYDVDFIFEVRPRDNAIVCRERFGSVPNI